MKSILTVLVLLLLSLPSALPSASTPPSLASNDVIASHGQLTVTGLQVALRLEREGLGEVVSSYENSRLANQLDETNTLLPIIRDVALDIMAERLLAAAAPELGITLERSDMASLRVDEEINLLVAFDQHVDSLFAPDVTEIERRVAVIAAREGIAAGGRQTISYETRVLFRRATGDEVPSTITFLEGVRRRILAGELSPADAVRQYSQAPSASRRGILAATPAEEMPPAIAAAVVQLREDEWSRPIVSGQGVVLVQLISIRESIFDPIEHIRHQVRHELRNEFAESLLSTFQSASDPTRRRISYAQAHRLPTKYPLGLNILVQGDQILAEMVLRHRAAEHWNALDQTGHLELFGRYQHLFPRMWITERREFHLKVSPGAGVEATNLSQGEVERLWHDGVAALALELAPGTYRRPPIPRGWELEIKAVRQEYHVEPSPGTPYPPANPAWRVSTLFSESEADIQRMGSPEFREETLLRFEEVEETRRREYLFLELLSDFRKSHRREVEKDASWAEIFRETKE